ncbi:bifunctional diguanylate cyclase/phosphodiesterase [Sphingosinicella sp. LHD-64]|uniref:putative bifunctional diguanylate cyclase/phosphodiesterase n=1 Tax=Sphingosinicella sp. LHD-64 TaxID=3072139 RepID=UPI00280EDF95|nr:bifunctional diguanylate cyclase/phosphodiesterase [Sphingosinicella sp. LHD-64]MDQ8757251.1 bifunctional diguanylate cyclase/phosphodiesterase [Sphingosinicella sp. LHD-64]
MGAPLFILSFRHRDELNRLAEDAGWQPIAARRADNAEARFVASGAAVAVVDARGALGEGVEAMRAIGDAAEANAAALLVLLSRGDAEALEQMYQFGATHFLVSPFTDAALIQALQFARRHAERVGPSSEAARRNDSETASWRWRPGSRSVELSAALARKAGLGEDGGRRISLMELFRKLDPEGRRAARSAVSRVLTTGEATAFAHRDSDGADTRIAHHVRVLPEGEIAGRAETIAPGGSSGSRDALTGLADSRSARAWLARRLDDEDSGGPVVALLLSVSRYDAINAAFGRDTGDAVLQAVGRRIQRVLDHDGRRRVVARMAGAEFAVLLSAPASLGDGRFLAGELVEAIGRPFVSGGHVITLASRAGVAVSQSGDDAAALLRRASAALAEAKGADSAPVRVLEEGAESATAREDRLEVDLRRALDRDEIEILFQPQVAVTSGEIVGAEALARWNHPLYGELGAGTLLRVAERSDYLAQLSDHVQRKAIRMAAAWPVALTNLRLAVNITAADILRPGFAAQFLASVAESGFDPRRLTVEVTESGLIEDLPGAAELLAELRRGGLRVAIDDFGTGYSNLAYLKALPLDYLKIDKRLSQDIAGSMRDRIVVRSVIDMARSLGLDVVAEGVETETQLSLLAEEGCTLYQGFLCAPPIGVGELARLTGHGGVGGTT